MSNLFRPDARAGASRLAAVIPACVFVVLSLSLHADAAEITVYTTRSIAVNAPEAATVVHLDAAEAIEAELSANLPHAPLDAAKSARERLLDGGAKLQRDLAAAYENIAEAWSLGVTTLPAVVIDRRYVVYGDADVARAATKIEAFRKVRP
ncbi:TIGR03757 family integrating conjugative element protein [Shinella sp.]|uniref:TIGR03757 family integrating conjugative element protein n=1 Tax=Shinella sp. TaxID=1870904 RepID=UPI0025829BE8|nr:TIGR03757 family integrating conjugative element protein [Shinella sp.]MCW5706959.1 TIGR03757 family integrating conjugative element protein [Shinella sp.]